MLKRSGSTELVEFLGMILTKHNASALNVFRIRALFGSVNRSLC